MSEAGEKTQKRQRRPQAERSAETQSRLIEAAIACLHRVGYGVTTVGMVADEAGVSRGALTHQFPSKTELMLAVVRHVFEQEAAFYAKALDAKPAAEALTYLPEIMWEVLSRPSAIAVTEIMLSTRSDPVLSDKLRLMQAEIDLVARDRITRRIAAAGLTDRPDGAAIHRLFVAAVRGLAIEAVSTGDRQRADESVRVLTEVLGLLYPETLRKN
jgi:AcrR family transcriptional regulator